MESKIIQLTLSADLVDQLEKVGLLEDMARVERIFEEALEREEAAAQRRAEAFKAIREIFEKLDSIPPLFTPEEIQAELDAYKAEQRAARENRD